MALRLMKVCVCGHGRETHQNPHAIPYRPEVTRCQYVEWEEEQQIAALVGDRVGRHIRISVACRCMWWRPLLIPRLRNVPLEHPS